MTGTPKGLDFAETTFGPNPDPCTSGGVCGDTDDVGEVETECEASGVSGSEDGYAGIKGLGMTGPSCGGDARGAKAGMEEPVLGLM